MTHPTAEQQCTRCGYPKSAHDAPPLNCCSKFEPPQQRVHVVALDKQQRARAVQLEECVAEDPALAAHELIYLRDLVATIADILSPLTHPDTKTPVGYHMCFVRDTDVPSLQRTGKTGEVRRG